MWNKDRLENLSEIVSGGTPSRDVPEYWNGDIFWATPSDITKCGTNYLSTTFEMITKAGLARSSAKLLPVGAILLTSRATVGEVKIAKVSICTNQGFKSLVAKNHINNIFLFYQIILNKKQIEKFAMGSTFVEINKKDISRIEIYYPEKREQLKIACILEKIDTAIEKTEILIAKYEKIKQGMMQDLFTRGVDENGQLLPSYIDAPHLYKDSPFGMIPKGWKVVTFGELIQENIIISIQDGNHGELHPKSVDFVNDGIPFIMANDIDNDGVIDFEHCSKITEKLYNSLRIGFSKAGDVLLTHKGTVGRVAIVPNKINKLMLTPQVTYYRLNEQCSLKAEYLYFFFRSPNYQTILKNLSAQSTRAYIGITEQKKLLIVLPPYPVQELIFEILQPIDRYLQIEKINSKKLREQKNGLMQDLLTGKVQVKLEKQAIA